MRISTVVVGLVIAVNLVACGEAHRDAATTYQHATELALINAGMCSDSRDCTAKEMAFWAGGSNLLPWTNKAYVTVYNVSDLKTISAIRVAIGQSRTSIKGPPCQLTVYAGTHSNEGRKVHDETL